MERLDKIIARCSAYSRKDAKRLCVRGMVTVNGKTVRSSSTRVNTTHPILVDGDLMEEPPLMVLYHKPKGVISTMQDEHGRACLAEVLPPRWRHVLHPVGRLDADTTGLLLFCGDGQITQYLLHPRRAIEREYIAQVEHPVDEEALKATLAAGVQTSEGVIPATLLEVKGQQVRLVVTEGKHRMVRRILANAGHPVLELHRMRYGQFLLGELKEGEVRPAEEIETIWLTER